MVSLTKKQAMDPLYSRFRALQLPPMQPTSEDPPRSISPLRQSSISPSTQRNQVVRYIPPDIRETRSQQDRLSRVDARDLQARLELISLESAKAVLA
jgi:hypothetical protein